jgi:hypothetical protein
VEIARIEAAGCEFDGKPPHTKPGNSVPIGGYSRSTLARRIH